MATSHLTRADVEELVDYLEAHWPAARSKWGNLATVYNTLAQFDADLLMAAAKRRVHEGDEHQPGPVDIISTAKSIIRERAANRRGEQGVSPDHPRGHVWGIQPDVLNVNGMRVAICGICGEEKRATPDRLVTVGESGGPGHDAEGVF